jgi:PadR family transcriptional regulator PadR
MSVALKKKSNSNFLNGVPVLLVLKLLSEKEMYGYEIVKAIEEKSGKSLAFAEGCIYPTLHVLEEDGHIKSYEKPINGRTRLYYGITPTGKKKLEQLTGEWEKISQGVRFVLFQQKEATA